MSRASLVLLILLSVASGRAQTPSPADTSKPASKVAESLSGALQAPDRVVSLTRTFFSEWRFTVDGVTFHEVGRGGEGIRGHLRSGDTVQAALKMYTYWKSEAVLLQYVTFTLITATGALAATDHYDDGGNILIGISAVTVTFSVWFDQLASSKLRKAVRLHNAEVMSERARTTLEVGPTMREGRVGLAMNVRF